jgi:predicted ATPase/class 3 adenylate cyclase
MKTCPRCGDQNSDRARFCQVCGETLAVEESPVPQEVRKTVSIVFCDLKGSTALGESVDPETLRRVIARYFNDMKTVLERHGGTVEKFIGDAVMAAFGIPTLHEDDALRAVRAADEMQKAMAGMNTDIELEFGVTLSARIGVNTGEVIAGDPSAGHGFVAGDAVNVAARLEQAAAPGEVLIGEPTFRLVRDAVQVQAIEPLELKGKSEPMPAYRLVEVIPNALGVSRRLDSPLVGREEEIASLTATFEAALREGVCRLATVYGTAGAGKSRLTQEFMAAVGERARVVRGRCLPYGEGITFWPIAEAIKEIAAIDEQESPEAARSKIEAFLPEGEESRLVCDRISAAIGLTETHGDTQETFWAFRKFIETLGDDGPLLVIFDDIHWAEPTMLDLIEYVVTFSQDTPMMILCLSRKELLDIRPTWGAGGIAITLDALSEDSVARLIENLLGNASLPEGVRRKITESAEGNPLYVEEILRMLIDDGVLQKSNGHWRAAVDITTFAIPPSIHALLTARLDRLNVHEQGVVQRGAVIGKEFWWSAVTDLSLESFRAQIGTYLQALVRKELIQPERSTFAGEDAFKFSHIMIRDAAYSGMPKELRAELHEKFATWLESKAGERIREYEEILGYHLEQAYKLREDLGVVDDHARDLGAQAAERLGNAGVRAFARADMPAAANLLGRAIGLLQPRDPRRIEFALDLSDALMEMGELKRAGEVLAHARRAADVVGDALLAARADLQLGVLKTYTNEDGWKEDVTQESERLLKTFGEFGYHQGLARSYILAAEVHWDDRNFAATDEALSHALEHAHRAQRMFEVATILSWLSSSAFWGPTPVEQAIERCEQILKSSKGNRLAEAKCLLRLAGLQGMRGRFDQARMMIATSRATLEDLGQLLYQAASAQEAGMVEMLAGDLEAAEREFREGYDALEEMEEGAYLGDTAALLAKALYELGRLEEAEKYTHISEEAAGDVLTLKPDWAPTRAMVLARRGEFEPAVTLAREAIEISATTDDLWVRGDAFMALAEILRMAEMNEDAALFVEKAIALYEAKGIVPAIEKAQARLASLRGGTA